MVWYTVDEGNRFVMLIHFDCPVGAAMDKDSFVAFHLLLFLSLSLDFSTCNNQQLC